MAKYDALRDALLSDRSAVVTMTFATIERLVGTLPKSAREYEAWWSNENWRTSSHVQAKAWGEAGYQTKVNLTAETVTFSAI